MENRLRQRQTFGDLEALLQTSADCLVLKNTGLLLPLPLSS
jgi:hypothetical protein